MIKNVRDVHDLSRLLGSAQGKIVILRQVELPAETAESNGKFAPVGAQMSDIHERVKQLGTPFWFEEWFCPLTRLEQTIFITVKDVGRGMAANRIG